MFVKSEPSGFSLFIFCLAEPFKGENLTNSLIVLLFMEGLALLRYVPLLGFLSIILWPVYVVVYLSQVVEANYVGRISVPDWPDADRVSDLFFRKGLLFLLVILFHLLPVFGYLGWVRFAEKEPVVMHVILILGVSYFFFPMALIRMAGSWNLSCCDPINNLLIGLSRPFVYIQLLVYVALLAVPAWLVEKIDVTPFSFLNLLVGIALSFYMLTVLFSLIGRFGSRYFSGKI